MKRILFDQGVPAPLRNAFAGRALVETAFERGWSRLRNGELLAQAEMAFDIFVTTDKNLRYQQNVKARTLAICVLPTSQWPILRTQSDGIVSEVLAVAVGGYVEIALG